MVSINRQWWEHLAPKVMHRRVRELEALLQSWTRSDYGAHWLACARRADGLVRVKPGQFIPVAHVIALPRAPDVRGAAGAAAARTPDGGKLRHGVGPAA